MHDKHIKTDCNSAALLCNQRALALFISSVEDEADNISHLLDNVCYRTGNAYRIGITDPFRAGKSTINENKYNNCRKNERKIFTTG